MPHARQGGRGVDAVAVTGSKVGGTGFENEHMGQIQVAFTGFNDGEGLFCGTRSGEAEFIDCRFEACDKDGLAPALFDLVGSFFLGFGYIVILGDDFRKPAYINEYRVATEREVILDTPLDQPPSGRSQPSICVAHR